MLLERTAQIAEGLPLRRLRGSGETWTSSRVPDVPEQMTVQEGEGRMEKGYWSEAGWDGLRDSVLAEEVGHDRLRPK